MVDPIDRHTYFKLLPSFFNRILWILLLIVWVNIIVLMMMMGGVHGEGAYVIIQGGCIRVKANQP